jgi:hypothetical protein
MSIHQQTRNRPDQDDVLTGVQGYMGHLAVAGRPLCHGGRRDTSRGTATMPRPLQYKEHASNRSHA